MCNDNRIGVASSLEGGGYTDHTESSDSYPSPPQEISRKCVCKLSVKFLLEQGRWVGDSQNLYQRIGHCNSFHEEVNNDSFPFLLGGNCVEVSEISGDEEVEDEGVNLEYSAEDRNIRCLACAKDGKYTTFNMYQSILRFETTKDGHTRPRLVSATTRVRDLPN